MAEITDFKISRSAAREIMKNPAVRADLINRAKRIRDAAQGMSESGNAKYGVATWDGEVSAHAVVYTANLAAKRSNAKHNSLIRSIEAGRG